MKIVDDKIYSDSEKIGWIEGSHVRAQDGTKLGYIQGEFIYNNAARKVAYIHENLLVFENGSHSIPVEEINEEIAGTVPVLMKCAVHVLLED